MPSHPPASWHWCSPLHTLLGHPIHHIAWCVVFFFLGGEAVFKSVRILVHESKQCNSPCILFSLHWMFSLLLVLRAQAFGQMNGTSSAGPAQDLQYLISVSTVASLIGDRPVHSAILVHCSLLLCTFIWSPFPFPIQEMFVRGRTSRGWAGGDRSGCSLPTVCCWDHHFRRSHGWASLLLHGQYQAWLNSDTVSHLMLLLVNDEFVSDQPFNYKSFKAQYSKPWVVCNQMRLTAQSCSSSPPRVQAHCIQQGADRSEGFRRKGGFKFYFSLQFLCPVKNEIQKLVSLF